MRNKATEEWEAAGHPPNGQRPGEGTVIGTGLGLRIDVPKYSAMSPLSGFVGDMEYIALYAGESCTLINEIKPAAEIVRDLVRESEEVIEQMKRL